VIVAIPIVNSLRLHVRVTGAVDDEDAAAACRSLRSELLEVTDVSVPGGAAPVPGAKSAAAAAVGALLVSATPAAIPVILDVALGWLRRQPIDIALEIDGQRISGRVTRDQRDQLVRAYLHRVQAGDNRP
jgi:hypothetical protein